MVQGKVMRALLLARILLLLTLAREGLGEPGATNILIEDQDQVSRVKRNSETGLVGEPVGGGGMEMVGEEERSVVGCGEVLLTCPSTTMIVVRSASFTPLGEGSRPAACGARGACSAGACGARGAGGNNQAIWRAVVDACSG